MLGLLLLASCADLDTTANPSVIHARFDPDARALPMPNNILRNAETGLLELPLDDETLSPAAREFYGFLNTLDGWSSASAATVEFTAPVAPTTINSDTVQVWEWRETPRRVDGLHLQLSAAETQLTVEAPRYGWERGATYVVMVRGGASGVEGKLGERVVADAAFYFLRLTESLIGGQHDRAFPGDTLAEKSDNAQVLEDIRLDLVPYFDFFEERGIERQEVASLWSFTVTEHVELAMDKASQRMPLPNNLVIDPQTGRVDLPIAAWDSPTIASAKTRLRELSGFGTSMEAHFGFTGPIDPASVTDETVALYEMSTPPRRVPITIRVHDDLMHVMLEPLEIPLAEETSYAVVVRDGIVAADNSPVSKMPLGHLIGAAEPVFADGASTIDAVEDDSALRVENMRSEAVPFISALGDDVFLAWTYKTMAVREPMRKWMALPAKLDIPTTPGNVQRMSPGQALLDFPLNLSLFFVGDVYHGTITSPSVLDTETRALRGDGGHQLIDVPFTMTVPRNVEPGQEIPVVIFGHGLMSERRFVLAVGDALAERGFAAIAIDFPFHGERSYCWSEGPLTVPNPQTGELTPIDDPCQDGTTCQADGRCVDAAGQGNALRRWPIIGMPQSSGAAMLEVEHITNTRDHFIQSLIDLSSLSRALRQGDWQTSTGISFRTDKLFYAGQSLGGIIGSIFVSLAPEVERAVLNVPGADVVDLFEGSPFFSGQIAAFFNREDMEQDSYEGRRFMNVARWIMDGSDPLNFAGLLADDERDVMVQMATLDFIIPNEFTEKLVEIAKVPQVNYIAEHGFIVLPFEPAYLFGVRHLSRFLSGDYQP